MGIIDWILLLVLAVTTWCVASDGVWGAAITFVGSLLAGLVAMNFFEPLARFMGANILTSYYWDMRWDIIALLGLFAGGVFLLRMVGEKLLPTYAETKPMLHDIGRWVFGAATGYVVTGVVLTALHTAPMPREFLGFQPERANLFDIVAPDRHWLGFTQYVSEKALSRSSNGRVVGFDTVEFRSNPDDPNSVSKWSSFPIRYAARREQFGRGGQATSPNQATSTPPPTVTPAPTSGGATGF